MAMRWHHFKIGVVIFHLAWLLVLIALLSLISGSGDLLTRQGQILFGANFCAGAMIGAALFFYRVHFGLYYSVIFIAAWAIAWCLLLIVSGRASTGALIVIPLAATAWAVIVLLAFRRDQTERRTELK